MEKKLEETVDPKSTNPKLQTFLLKLSDTLRPLDNPVDIEEVVTKITRDFLDADWCLYASMEEDNLVILRDAVREGLPSLVGTYHISNFALFKAILDVGSPLIVDDVQNTDKLDEELKQLCIKLQNISFINVPVIKNGKPVGLFSVVQSKPRKWTDTEVLLSIETADRTWAAVERAKAEEALRKSEEKYRSLFNSILDAFCIIEMIFNEKEEPIDWIYVETNPAFSKHATVEMKGKRISEIVPEMEEFWLEKYGGVAKTGQPVQLEHIVKGLGNQWFQTSAFSHGPKDSNRVAVLFRNITERKQAEEKIKESESRFHTMADASPVLIWTISADGLSSYYNKTFLDFIGVSKDEDISDWQKIVHPDDIQSTFETINSAIAVRCSYSLECRLLRADGQWRWVLAQGNPNIGVDNEFMGFVGSSVDITERKQAEEKIKESEAFSRSILESSPDCVKVIDIEGRVTYMNFNGLYTMEIDDFSKIKNKPWWSLWGKENEQTVRAATAKSLNGETSRFQAMCPTVKGTNQWWDVLVSPIATPGEKISQLISVSRDITSQVEQRKEIEDSESLFRMALFLTAQTVFKQDKQLRYTWIYNTHPKFVAQELIGKIDSEILDKDAAEILTSIKQSVLNTGKTFTGNIQFEIEGQLTVFLARIEATKDIAGQINGIIAVTNDITERKQAENKIKESEQEIRKIKEQLELSIRAGKIGVWHWDVKNDILHWSKEQKVIYGIDDSEAIINSAQFNALIVPEDLKRIQDDQSAGNILEHEYDFRIIRKSDGEVRWIKSRARNVVDQQGALQFISGVNIDITEQVIALTKLQASEEKFKRLVLQAPVAICVLRGADYVIETMNDNMCALWDRTLAQALNKPVFDVLPEVKDQGIKELLDNVYFTGERCVIEELSVNMRRNGKLENTFVKLVYEPLREADGTISGVMALAHEITEQVMARKKVEESEKRFEAAILAVEGIIWTSNAQGEMIGKQPGWAKLTGQHFEEYQGYGWAKAIHPDDAQPTLSAWTDAVNNQRTFEFEHRVKTKQNDWRLFSVKAVPAFDKTGAIQQWISVHTDITEQKLAEEKLTYRTALLEAHNQASVDGILLVDAKGKIISFNQCFIEIWNMPQHIVDAKDDEAALSFAMTQLVNPQLFIDKVKYHYEHPTEMCLDELDFKDGKIVERNGYPVIGDDGTYYAWSWTFRDITEQKNYEKIIIESEQRFRTLAETLPQLIWMTNEKGAYEYASSHWINYSGLDPYAGDTWEKLVHPHDLESLAQGWESSLKTGKTFNSEARLKNKNGMYSWHLVQGEPIKSEQGTIIKWIGAFTDIENLKEEQKQKNDFLSMASHELRTPVTTIKGYGQIIERLLEEKNDLKTLGFVKKMTKQVNRLDTLITDLLDITKMQKGGLIRNESVFNFNDLVKEVIDDMQKTTFTHQIIDNLNADLEIKGDKDKLSQVLNNLISNATKYSPAADKIIVSTQIVKDGVQLSVQDFGIGISIEGQQRVFEQFYRVAGENQSTFQGMGIGLYICAEIIKKEGGTIWVESAGVKGSMFYVWLPVDHKDGTEGQ